MEDAMLWAFPALLAATYGVYYVGRKHVARFPWWFEVPRSLTLGGVTGTIVASLTRLQAMGRLEGWHGQVVLVTSVASAGGLLLMQGLRLVQADEARSARRAGGEEHADGAAVREVLRDG